MSLFVKMFCGEDAVEPEPATRPLRPEAYEEYRRHVNGECPGCELCEREP